LARQAHAKFIQRTQLAKFIAKQKLSFDCIIHATPVGMEELNGKSKVDEKPLLTEAELATRYVFEMISTPAETRFTRMARAKGIHVIPGVEMLVHQGARQFEIWT